VSTFKLFKCVSCVSDMPCLIKISYEQEDGINLPDQCIYSITDAVVVWREVPLGAEKREISRAWYNGD